MHPRAIYLHFTRSPASIRIDCMRSFPAVQPIEAFGNNFHTTSGPRIVLQDHAISEVPYCGQEVEPEKGSLHQSLRLKHLVDSLCSEYTGRPSYQVAALVYTTGRLSFQIAGRQPAFCTYRAEDLCNTRNHVCDEPKCC